jgi:hypothetical protein
MEEASRGVALSPSGRNIAIAPSPRVPSVRPPAGSISSVRPPALSISSVRPPAASVPPASTPTHDEPTVLERRVGLTDHGQARRSSRALWIAAGVGVALTAASLFVTRREPPRAAVDVVPSASAPATPGSEAPQVVAPPVTTPEDLQAAPEPAASAPTKKKSPKPRAAPNACNPPYWTDGSGQRRYKIECLRTAK